MNELELAKQVFKESVTICTDLVGCDPHRALWYRDLAVSHYNLGYVLEQMGDRTGALKEYQASVEPAEKAKELATWRPGGQNFLPKFKRRLKTFLVQEQIERLTQRR